MDYFAYGSNLHPARLRARVGDVELVATAVLRGARLAFRKVGQDGSAKADVVFAQGTPDTVPGAVYRLTEEQAVVLDGVEGVGRGYERRTVDVELDGAERRRCFTYLAMPAYVDETLRPFAWYVELVVHGAGYHGFAREYVERLMREPTVSDPDPARAAKERGQIDD